MDLFQWNEARSRKEHPVSSHLAAERMNANGRKGLNQQQRIVLRALKENNGATAKQLGKVMARTDMDRYSWPHKRLKELKNLGFVHREDGYNEFLCFITDAGAKYLKDSSTLK